VNSNPEDTRLIPVSRTVGVDRLVDEIIFCFTHTCEIPWMLPGIETARKLLDERLPSSELMAAAWAASESEPI
jgi:carboxymethylenebutenolidase